MIGLERLHNPEYKEEAVPDVRSDTGSMFLLPASKAASYIAVLAFASSRLLGDLIESLGHDAN